MPEKENTAVANPSEFRATLNQRGADLMWFWPEAFVVASAAWPSSLLVLDPHSPTWRGEFPRPSGQAPVTRPPTGTHRDPGAFAAPTPAPMALSAIPKVPPPRAL